MMFFENESALGPDPEDSSEPTVYGRAWTCDELRIKSFEDLHQLWYVLLRECNLLCTQRAEATRLQQRWFGKSRLHKCRLSMAHIKTVLTERVNMHKRAEEMRKATSKQSHINKVIGKMYESNADQLLSPPIKTEAELLTEWQKDRKMDQLWRQREFRKRINYRQRRIALFS